MKLVGCNLVFSARSRRTAVTAVLAGLGALSQQPALAIMPGPAANTTTLQLLANVFPSSVAIFADGPLLGNGWCSGTMLSAYVLLTAAHCLSTERAMPVQHPFATGVATMYRPVEETYSVAQGGDKLFSSSLPLPSDLRLFKRAGPGAQAYGEITAFITTDYPLQGYPDLALALVAPSRGTFVSGLIPLANANTEKALLKGDFNSSAGVVNRPLTYAVGHSFGDDDRTRMAYQPVLAEKTEDVPVINASPPRTELLWAEPRADVVTASAKVPTAQGPADPNWIRYHGTIVSGDSGGGLFGVSQNGGYIQIGVAKGISRATGNNYWTPVAPYRSFIDTALASLTELAGVTPGASRLLPALPGQTVVVSGGSRKSFSIPWASGWVFLDPQVEQTQYIDVTSGHTVFGIDVGFTDPSSLQFETFDDGAGEYRPLAYTSLDTGALLFANGVTRLRIVGELDTDGFGNTTLGFLVVQDDPALDQSFALTWETLAPVPEPATILLFSVGLIGLFAVRVDWRSARRRD